MNAVGEAKIRNRHDIRSGTLPHPTLADARATFSRKREKGGAAFLVGVAILALGTPVRAERSHKVDKPSVYLPPASPPATPAPPPETKPYDAQLMRLAEILGALTYMRGLCGEKDADAWRGRMQSLLDAEGTPPVRKERLAGAYNKGIQGYSLSYRTCTPNAHIVIDRFLSEGERIAKEVENRYHAS